MFVPRRSIAQRWASTLFLISCFLHSCSAATDVGVQFLEDVGLIRIIVVCCECWSQTSWCGDTNRKDGYRWRFEGSHLLPHALLLRQSGTVHGFSRVLNEGFVPHVRYLSLTRPRSRARVGMWKHSSIPTIGWVTVSITSPTICLRRSADPITLTSSIHLAHKVYTAIYPIQTDPTEPATSNAVMAACGTTSASFHMSIRSCTPCNDGVVCDVW
jgi:hypothetical protein